MRPILVAAAALATLTLPAAAQEALDTPSGPLTIEEGDLSVTVVLGDRRFPFKEMMYASFPERVGDLVLVQVSSGGNGCPAEYAWLDVSAGKGTMTDLFGTCSDLYTLSHDAETVTVAMPSMVPGEGDVAFVWDGKGPVIEKALGLPASGHAPGTDGTAWIGEHPYKLVNSSDWEPPLTALIGTEMLGKVRQAMGLSSGMAEDGDWIAGQGVEKFTGDEAAVAVSRDGTRLLVAYRPAGGEGTLWGDPGGPLPAAVAAVAGGS